MVLITDAYGAIVSHPVVFNGTSDVVFQIIYRELEFLGFRQYASNLNHYHYFSLICLDSWWSLPKRLAYPADLLWALSLSLAAKLLLQ